MFDHLNGTSAAVISQETLLLRLEQSEELRSFTIQMWLQNPRFARQAGARARELLTPLNALPLTARKETS